VAPIWDWAERVGVNQTPITPAAQSGIADRAASGGWGGAAAPGGGGQARWKVKPAGFRTVLRNGWYYRA
jgi:hypothetical protein